MKSKEFALSVGTNVDYEIRQEDGDLVAVNVKGVGVTKLVCADSLSNPCGLLFYVMSSGKEESRISAVFRTFSATLSGGFFWG